MIRGIIICLFLAVPVFGQVNLKLVAHNVDYHVGDIAEVDLVATTYDDPKHICCMDVLLAWEPGVLELIGHYDPDDQDWLLSRFWDVWDINANIGAGLPETDGDAIYSAWSQLGVATVVTPGTEMIITTFLFKILTPVKLPMVIILPSAPEIEGEGYQYLTRIFDDDANEVAGKLSGTQPPNMPSLPPVPVPEPDRKPKGNRANHSRIRG